MFFALLMGGIVDMTDDHMKQFFLFPGAVFFLCSSLIMTMGVKNKQIHIYNLSIQISLD